MEVSLFGKVLIAVLLIIYAYIFVRLITMAYFKSKYQSNRLKKGEKNGK